MNSLQGLTLPLKYKDSAIADATGKIVLEANRDSKETPLTPTGRDALLMLTCCLLNNSFEYGEADIILNKLGY